MYFYSGKEFPLCLVECGICYLKREGGRGRGMERGEERERERGQEGAREREREKSEGGERKEVGEAGRERERNNYSYEFVLCTRKQ